MKLKLRKLRKKRDLQRFRKGSLSITEYKYQSWRRRGRYTLLEKFEGWKRIKWFSTEFEIFSKSKKRRGKNKWKKFPWVKLKK